MMNTIIETQRILLRPFTLEDVQAVFDFGSNKEVQKYTGDVLLKSKKEAEKIITDIYFEDYKTYGYGRWAVVYKPTNNVIGFAGLKFLPEIQKTDIGFRFLPEYWGKGLATEIAKELITYGFETLNLTEIIGIADPKNSGSCKVLEKIGLVLYKKDTYLDDGEKQYYWYKKTAVI